MSLIAEMLSYCLIKTLVQSMEVKNGRKTLLKYSLRLEKCIFTLYGILIVYF